MTISGSIKRGKKKKKKLELNSPTILPIIAYKPCLDMITSPAETFPKCFQYRKWQDKKRAKPAIKKFSGRHTENKSQGQREAS